MKDLREKKEKWKNSVIFRKRVFTFVFIRTVGWISISLAYLKGALPNDVPKPRISLRQHENEYTRRSPSNSIFQKKCGLGLLAAAVGISYIFDKIKDGSSVLFSSANTITSRPV